MQWVKNSILFTKKIFSGINIWIFRISDTTELIFFSSSNYAFDIKFVCSRCNSLFQIFIDFFSHKRVYQSKIQWKIQHLEDFRSICNIFYSYEMDKEWDCLVWKIKEKMMKTAREINCHVCCDEISNFSYLSCVKYCHLHTWFFAFLTLVFALFELELLCDNGARMSMRYQNSGVSSKINASIYLLTWRPKCMGVLIVLLLKH